MQKYLTFLSMYYHVQVVRGFWPEKSPNLPAYFRYCACIHKAAMYE